MQHSLHIGSYTILYRIGSGSFASVYMGVSDLVGYPVAIKQINKKSDLNREIDILKMAMHQYVVELFEVIDGSENGDDQFVYLVMELAQNGSLRSLLLNDDCQALSECEARKIFSQVIIAVGYLHDKLNIIHRDLKAENILFDKNNNIRLVDFGLSTNSASDALLHRTACGSPAYAAPEVILHDNYTKSADIWSLGILLFLMTTGRFPYEASSVTRLLHEIVSLPLEVPNNLNLSKELVNLLYKILQKKPETRISLVDIMKHPWFTNHGYNFTLIGNRSIFDSLIIDDSIDLQIVEEMIKKGIDVNNLKNDILNHEFNQTTATYRIMRRSKVMDEFQLISPANNSLLNSSLNTSMNSSFNSSLNSTLHVNGASTNNNIFGDNGITMNEHDDDNGDTNMNLMGVANSGATTMYRYFSYPLKESANVMIRKNVRKSFATTVKAKAKSAQFAAAPANFPPKLAPRAGYKKKRLIHSIPKPPPS